MTSPDQEGELSAGLRSDAALSIIEFGLHYPASGNGAMTSHQQSLDAYVNAASAHIARQTNGEPAMGWVATKHGLVAEANQIQRAVETALALRGIMQSHMEIADLDGWVLARAWDSLHVHNIQTPPDNTTTADRVTKIAKKVSTDVLNLTAEDQIAHIQRYRWGGGTLEQGS